MDMELDRKKRFIINTTYFALCAAIVYVLLRFVMFWVMPFVIGFGVAFILKPVINVLTRFLKISRKPVAILVVLLFYGTVGVLIAVAVFQIFLWLKDFVYQLPYLYTKEIEPYMLEIFGNLERIVGDLDPQLMASLQEVSSSIFDQLASLVSGISKGLLGFVSGAAVRVPLTLIFTLFTMISSFFIAIDYYEITTFITRQFNEKNRNLIFDIKRYLVGTVFRFIGSYALIMFITFLELAVGLTFLRVENSVTVAALIAMVDVLPVLGTGGVMIPWVIIEAIGGNYSMALGLLMLYLFITIIRNIIEPRIVGTNVGLHPLLMLLSMYLGARLFGALGIVILPFMMIVIKNLNDNGKIKLFK